MKKPNGNPIWGDDLKNTKKTKVLTEVCNISEQCFPKRQWLFKWKSQCQTWNTSQLLLFVETYKPPKTTQTIAIASGCSCLDGERAPAIGDITHLFLQDTQKPHWNSLKKHTSYLALTVSRVVLQAAGVGVGRVFLDGWILHAVT